MQIGSNEDFWHLFLILRTESSYQIYKDPITLNPMAMEMIYVSPWIDIIFNINMPANHILPSSRLP